MSTMRAGGENRRKFSPCKKFNIQLYDKWFRSTGPIHSMSEIKGSCVIDGLILSVTGFPKRDCFDKVFKIEFNSDSGATSLG